MQGDLIEQGMDLMIYGMGTVVMFLTLLVVSTVLMSRFILRFFPDPEQLPDSRGNSSGQGAAPPVDARIEQVIKQAIKQHRDKRG
ncbi:MAG TPA: OadG family transporter subunit [Cellvibrionaceae bacterium]